MALLNVIFSNQTKTPMDLTKTVTTISTSAVYLLTSEAVPKYYIFTT